jgi:hypothetical protein
MPRWEAMVLGMSVAALAGWAAGKHVATPRTGFIELNVEPADATVLVDDVKVGIGSRVTVERPPGSYTVSVRREGYARSEQTVDVVAGGSTPLWVRLEVSPETGFELTSEPPGVPVWLDGKPMRNPPGNQLRTPFRASRIRPGRHVLEVREAPFKKWMMEIDVQPGALTRFHAAMVRER